MVVGVSSSIYWKIIRGALVIDRRFLRELLRVAKLIIHRFLGNRTHPHFGSSLALCANGLLHLPHCFYNFYSTADNFNFLVRGGVNG